jgi:hypothetical protein
LQQLAGEPRNDADRSGVQLGQRFRNRLDLRGTAIEPKRRGVQVGHQRRLGVGRGPDRDGRRTGVSATPGDEESDERQR